MTEILRDGSPDTVPTSPYHTADVVRVTATSFGYEAVHSTVAMTCKELCGIETLWGIFALAALRASCQRHLPMLQPRSRDIVPPLGMPCAVSLGMTCMNPGAVPILGDGHGLEQAYVLVSKGAEPFRLTNVKKPPHLGDNAVLAQSVGLPYLSGLAEPTVKVDVLSRFGVPDVEEPTHAIQVAYSATHWRFAGGFLPDIALPSSVNLGLHVSSDAGSAFPFREVLVGEQ